MSRIAVSYMHGRGLIFDAEDYLKLRYEHRIVGNLIGVPVSHPRNVNQQGMPVALSTCELKLLLDSQLIRLVDTNGALQRAPSDEEVDTYVRMVERQKEELHMPVVEKRLEAFRKHLPKIIDGKRKKLLKTGVKAEDIHLDAEQLVDEERTRIMHEKFDAMVQIPLKYPLPFECSLELSSDETVKYRVFKSLWHQGGFITTGDAFGCDFLLYPGDPMYFHASHMVHVMQNGIRQTFDVKYLIRVCRLSVVVNKLCVLAYIDEGTDEVQFETLEWEGNAANKGDTF
ncbi:tRNA-splicing endonuclease subunit Sen34 isoform X2 [Anopheles stephensi]|uniref:tRNA-splicing endonuclease subunit Sen34 isoform X2 n=1 Tax=Anopheles stephensi TaxID=30069 RepID=UPI00165893D2|nr:tRNA-splicing endonuclease subunit Sen34 isoform X2 [Anopheles stephensi]